MPQEFFSSPFIRFLLRRFLSLFHSASLSLYYHDFVLNFFFLNLFLCYESCWPYSSPLFFFFFRLLLSFPLIWLFSMVHLTLIHGTALLHTFSLSLFLFVSSTYFVEISMFVVWFAFIATLTYHCEMFRFTLVFVSLKYKRQSVLY